MQSAAADVQQQSDINSVSTTRPRQKSLRPSVAHAPAPAIIFWICLCASAIILGSCINCSTLAPACQQAWNLACDILLLLIIQCIDIKFFLSYSQYRNHSSIWYHRYACQHSRQGLKSKTRRRVFHMGASGRPRGRASSSCTVYTHSFARKILCNARVS